MYSPSFTSNFDGKGAPNLCSIRDLEGRAVSHPRSDSRRIPSMSVSPLPISIPDVWSDGELLARVARQSEEPTKSREAQTEIYRRHVRYLYGVIRHQSGRLLELAQLTAEDLVQETFRRAFERANTFKPDPHLDEEGARRRTRAWLGRIANNLLAEALDRPREVAASSYVDRVSCEIDDESPPSSPRLRQVREGLALLSDREQDVLRVTAIYQRSGELHQRLPNAVAEELAARWQTTSDNIRAIRSRALKKLRAYLTSSRVIPEAIS